MPSPMTVSIWLRPHLVDFMVSIYGPQPIGFPRKDNFSLMLHKFLQKETPSYSRYRKGYAKLTMKLPYFEDKNVLSNFNLLPWQQATLISKIEVIFRLTFRDEINEFLLLGIKRKDAIYLFMEKHGISEDSFDMLKKDYHRYRICRRVKNHRKDKKILSVKSAFCPAGNAM
jgi:hypothetical protein